jgi:4'-phosphopantetheinyl transferase EntD
LIGAHREPRWPPGVVGSITHTDGYCAVAVTWSDQVAGIGIDAEPHVALSEDLIRMVCTQAERQWIAGAARIDGLHWGTLFFSAKESIFKAWFPIAHRWLDFQDAELSIDVERRTFEVRLCVGGPVESGERPISFRGRFAIVGSYVMTATVAEVAQPASGTTPSERSVQLPRSKRVPGIKCW